METPALKVSDLTKRYGDVTALDGATFSVEAGEIFGFLGPNGAGKTTTINVLTGLARPTSGSVRVLGYTYPAGLTSAQARIGVVPDESNLYPEMDGFDNLCFCAALYGISRDTRERRARDLLERFELADVGSRPFAAYSRGMKRKLTIAAALIHDPDILFLDEPTTGIDVASARGIRRLLGDLRNDGVTIFLTTHYIEEAERLCGRIAFIVGGSIVRIDAKEDLLSEADGSSTLSFSLDGDARRGADLISSSFPDLLTRLHADGTLTVISPGEMDLMPILRAFDGAGIPVYEARLVRPSLEDVFVRITGIEAEEMKRHKEGSGR